MSGVIPHLSEDLRDLVPIAIATALGGALGWERQVRGKVAGLRTHMLVALSTAAFVVVAGIAPAVAQEHGSPYRLDPIRVVQAVVIGIGFVGSGIVQATTREHGADGLTTAVSIWCTAAVGIAAGLRHYVLAAAIAALSLVVLRPLKRLEPGGRAP